MAVRAVLTMTVAPQAGAEFEQEWAAVASWVERFPGCLRQTLSRHANGDQATTYVITSDWSDRLTFHNFEISSRQDEATRGLRRLRTSTHMDVLDIIDHRGKS